MIEIKTSNELYSYIDELNKFETNDYSEDELLTIGMLHKNLPKEEKNWNNLANYVGYVNGDAYRNFVNRHINKLKSIKVTEDKPEQINTQNDINETYETLYKEKTKIRDIYNQYRLSLRKDSRIESFISELKNVASELPKLNIDTDKVFYKPNESEAVLLFSDLHIGVDCNNFYNTYNLEIAQKRLSKLANDVKLYCKNFCINCLNVLNLGDMIHGFIHVTNRVQSEMLVSEQILIAADLISKFLVEIESCVLNITYRSCTDNHSRMIANIKENIEEENFSRIIDVIVEERLKNSKSKVVFCKDNIDPSIMLFKLKNDKLIMAAHGHLENADKVIDNFSGANKVIPDYVFLGHYHASRMKQYNSSKLFINGSIVGTDEYALSKRLFNEPEQLLIIFDGNNVIDCEINLK